MSDKLYQDPVDQVTANEVMDNDRKLELINCKDMEISRLKSKLINYIDKVKENQRKLKNDIANKDKLVSNLKLELKKKTSDYVLKSNKHSDQLEKLKVQHKKELSDAQAFAQNKLEQLKSQNDRIEKIVERRVMQMKNIVSVSKQIRSESKNLQYFNELQLEEINELKLTQQLTQTIVIQSKDKSTDCLDLNQENSSREGSCEDLRLELKANICAKEKLNKLESENEELKNLVSCNKSLINSLRAYCKKYREKSESLEKENKVMTELNARTEKQDQADKSTDCSDLQQETVFICHDLEELKKAKDLAEEKLFNCETKNYELQKTVNSKIDLAKKVTDLANKFRNSCDNLKKENKLQADELKKLKFKEEQPHQEKILKDKSTDCLDIEEASLTERYDQMLQEKLSIEEKLKSYEKDNNELKGLVLNKSELIRNLRILGKQLRQKNSDLESETKALSAKLNQLHVDLNNQSKNKGDLNCITNNDAVIKSEVPAEDKSLKYDDTTKVDVDESKVSNGNDYVDRDHSESEQDNMKKNKKIAVEDNHAKAPKNNQQKIIGDVESKETLVITHKVNQKNTVELQEKNRNLLRELNVRTKRNKRLVLLGRQYREKCRNLEEKIKSKDESIQVLTDQVESYLSKEKDSSEILKNYSACNINILKDNESLKNELTKNETIISSLRSAGKLFQEKNNAFNLKIRSKEIKIEKQNLEIAALKEKLTQKESDEAEYAESFEIQLENIKKRYDEKVNTMKRSVKEKTITENEQKNLLNALTEQNSKYEDDLIKVNADLKALNESLSKEVESKQQLIETVSKINTENQQMKIRIQKLIAIAKRLKERCETTEDLFEVEAKEINELNDKVYQLTLKNNSLQEEINRLNLDFSQEKYDLLKTKIKKVKIIGRWFRDHLINLLKDQEFGFHQTLTSKCLVVNYSFRQPVHIDSVVPKTETELDVEKDPALNLSANATKSFAFASPLEIDQPGESLCSFLSPLGTLFQLKSSKDLGVVKNDDIKNMDEIDCGTEKNTESIAEVAETSVVISNSKTEHCITSSKCEVSLSSSDISLSEDEEDINYDPTDTEDKKTVAKQDHDSSVKIGLKRKSEETEVAGKRKKNGNDSGFVESCDK